MVMSKGLLLTLVFGILQLKPVMSLSCLACNWPSVEDCFSITNPSSIPSFSCPYEQAQNPYCETAFTMNEGIILFASRYCASGLFDYDSSTTSIPKQEKCVTTWDADFDEVEITICSFSCNDTNNCNNVTSQNLKLCPFNCGPFGSCDYIEGKCKCKPGYTGDDCQNETTPVPVFRQCVQCDSEFESSCSQMNESVPCPNSNQKYCATSHTTTFDQDGKTIREYVVRSCTDTFKATDECFISRRADVDFEDIQYTCVSTCGTDGCNIGIPDGKSGNGETKQPLRCVVCDSTETDWDSCATSTDTTLCSDSDTHCMSSVSYFTSDKTDLPYDAEPNYEPERIVRSCSNGPVSRECKSEVIGSSSLQKVACQESCQTDGCNTGWPARPLCSQCSCEQCASDNPCVQIPPQAAMCSMPYHKYCTIQDINRAISNGNAINGYPRSLNRGCSYNDIGSICVESKNSLLLENCNKSCSDDGCNFGFSEIPSTAPRTVARTTTTTSRGSGVVGSFYSLLVAFALMLITCHR